MDLLNLVGGQWIEGSGAPFTDANPARPAETVASGRFASAEEVRRAITAAREAAAGWAAAPHHDRAAVLVKAAGIIEANAEAWGRAAREFFTHTVTVYLGAPA